MKDYLLPFAALLSLYGCQSGAPAATPVQLSADQRKIVNQSVSLSLKDRFSPAQAGLVAAKAPTGDITVCGTLNASKNDGHDLFLGVLKGGSFNLETASSDQDEKVSVFHGCQARGIANWDVGLPPA